MYYNLISSKNTLLAYIRDNLMDESNLSIRGLTGLCGVDDRALIRGAEFVSAKLAVTMTEKGFEASALARSGFNAEATWLVIEYFAYESKAKAEGAKQLARTFGSIGIMETFKQLSKPETKQEVKRIDTTTEKYYEMVTGLPQIEDLSLRQLLRDRIEDELSVGRNILAPTKVEYTIGKVRATELGYSSQEIGNGGGLGKYLKKNVPIAYNERVGKYNVNHYVVNDELDTAIKTYFGMKRSLS